MSTTFRVVPQPKTPSTPHPFTSFPLSYVFGLAKKKSAIKIAFLPLLRPAPLLSLLGVWRHGLIPSYPFGNS